MIIGIGAKPAVGPFESIGLNNKVGGIQVSLLISRILQCFRLPVSFIVSYCLVCSLLHTLTFWIDSHC